MRPSHPVAWIVLSVALLTIPGQGSPAAEPSRPPEYLEVEQVSMSRAAGHPTFNMGRPYVVSINQKLPEAKTAHDRLVSRLHDGNQLGEVVFEWFGKEAPQRLNLKIGKNVSVEVAQAAIGAFAADSKLPVYLQRMSADGDFGNTRRIYVGGLVNSGTTLTTAEQIEALLRPGLTHAELMRLLPEVGK